MNKGSQDKKSFWSVKKIFSKKYHDEDEDSLDSEKEIHHNKVVFENGDLVSKDKNIVINWTKTYANLINNKFSSLKSISNKSLNRCIVYKCFENSFIPQFSFDIEYTNDKKSLSVNVNYEKDNESFTINHSINDVNRKEFDFQKMLDFFYENNRTVDDLQESDFYEFITDEIDNDYYVTITQRNIADNELEIVLKAKRSFGVFKSNTYIFKNLKIDANFVKPKWSILLLFLKEKKIYLEDLNEDIIRQGLSFAYGRENINKIEYEIEIEKDYAKGEFALTINSTNTFNEILDNKFVCSNLNMSADSVFIDVDATMEEYLNFKNSVSLFNFDVKEFANHIVYYFKDQKFVDVREGVFSQFKVRARNLLDENYKSNTISIVVVNENFVDNIGQQFKKEFEIRNLKIDLNHIKFNLSSFATNIKWKNMNFFKIDEEYLTNILRFSEITYHNVLLNSELSKFVTSMFKVQILEKDFFQNLFKIRIYVDETSNLSNNFLNTYEEQIFVSKDLTRMVANYIGFNTDLITQEILTRISENSDFDKFVSKFVWEQIYSRDNTVTNFFKNAIKLNIKVEGSEELIENPNWLEIINIDSKIDKYGKKFVDLSFEVLNLLKTNGETLKFNLRLKFNTLVPEHPFIIASVKEI